MRQQTPRSGATISWTSSSRVVSAQTGQVARKTREHATLLWQGLLARLLRFTSSCIKIKTACDTQRHKHSITVFLHYTHTRLPSLSLSIYLSLSLSLSHTHTHTQTHTHTHTRCRKHWWNKHMSRATKHALTLPSCCSGSSASYLRFVLVLSASWPLFCAIERHFFLFLQIEITFIFLIFLKLVMSCTQFTVLACPLPPWTISHVSKRRTMRTT
jgi:hypothetical protein